MRWRRYNPRLRRRLRRNPPNYRGDELHRYRQRLPSGDALDQSKSITHDLRMGYLPLQNVLQAAYLDDAASLLATGGEVWEPFGEFSTQLLTRIRNILIWQETDPLVKLKFAFSMAQSFAQHFNPQLREILLGVINEHPDDWEPDPRNPARSAYMTQLRRLADRLSERLVSGTLDNLNINYYVALAGIAYINIMNNAEVLNLGILHYRLGNYTSLLLNENHPTSRTYQNDYAKLLIDALVSRQSE